LTDDVSDHGGPSNAIVKGKPTPVDASTNTPSFGDESDLDSDADQAADKGKGRAGRADDTESHLLFLSLLLSRNLDQCPVLAMSGMIKMLKTKLKFQTLVSTWAPARQRYLRYALPRLHLVFPPIALAKHGRDPTG
jgi:hypothetical protein